MNRDDCLETEGVGNGGGVGCGLLVGSEFRVRTGDLRYELHILEPIQVERTRDRVEDVRAAAQTFADQFEGMIRRYPDSWFCWWARWPADT